MIQFRIRNVPPRGTRILKEVLKGIFFCIVLIQSVTKAFKMISGNFIDTKPVHKQLKFTHLTPSKVSSAQ